MDTRPQTPTCPHPLGTPSATARARMDALVAENAVLGRELARAQQRCARLAAEQAERIEALQREAVQLRGQAVAAQTLAALLQDDLRALLAAQRAGPALESALAAADLVICQVGCVSHNAYWRVQDHCKRTGKRCVLVESPSAAHLQRALADIGDRP